MLQIKKYNHRGSVNDNYDIWINYKDHYDVNKHMICSIAPGKRIYIANLNSYHPQSLKNLSKQDIKVALRYLILFLKRRNYEC